MTRKSLRSIFWLAISFSVTLLFVMPIFLLPAPIALSRPSLVSSTSHLSSNIRLTNGNWSDLYAVLSPDGKEIAFESNRSGNFAIWMIDADQTHLTRLTYLPGDQIRPHFSPVGNDIAFLSINQEKNYSDLFVLRKGSTNPVDISNGTGYVENFEWSPDGKKIAYDSFRSGSWNIWLANVLDNHLSAMLSTKESGWNLRYPSWGPNASWIAFSLDSTGDFHIWSYNLLSRELVQLTKGTGNDTRPSVSPNGEYIAYVSDIGGPLALFVMNSNGSNNFQAVSDPQEQSPGLSWTPEVSEDSSPEWNPQSQGVMFFSKDPYMIGSNMASIFVYYSNITVQGYISGSAALNPSNFQILSGSSIVAGVEGSSGQMFPSWGKNGTMILYSLVGSHQCNLWLKVLNTTAPKSAYG